jgi:hypothetical protein
VLVVLVKLRQIELLEAHQVFLDLELQQLNPPVAAEAVTILVMLVVQVDQEVVLLPEAALLAVLETLLQHHRVKEPMVQVVLPTPLLVVEVVVQVLLVQVKTVDQVQHHPLLEHL